MHASLFDGYCPQLLQRPVAAAGSQSVKWGSLVTSVRTLASAQSCGCSYETSCANAKRHVRVWWLSRHARKEASLIMDLVGSARYCSQSHPFVPLPFVPHHCVILTFRLQVGYVQHAQQLRKTIAVCGTATQATACAQSNARKVRRCAMLMER